MRSAAARRGATGLRATRPSWPGASGVIEERGPRRIAWADIVVDALFGAGLARPLDGAAAAVVARQRSRKPVLAVDVPSGLDGTTGQAAGPVVQATAP